jgi:hypothetical protein
MGTLLISLLQCGLFILIPISTFGTGLWLIRKLFDKKKSFILIALLIGFSFFEASMIGMLIDPRGGFSRFTYIIKTASLIGVVVTLSVLLFAPIYQAIAKLFK